MSESDESNMPPFIGLAHPRRTGAEDMSDIMLEGVLRMPYEMAMGSEIGRRQYYDRAQQAVDRIAQLEAESLEQSRQIVRLCGAIDYIKGIAERGESRKCGDDEQVEDFVLGYVKKLEAENAALKEKLAMAESFTHALNGLHAGDMATLKAEREAAIAELKESHATELTDLVDERDEAIAEAVAKEREKPYWLIECREGFVGWYALGKRFDCRFFDTNPVHAVRFDTREKAEDLIARLGTSCMTATEHLDISAIRTAP